MESAARRRLSGIVMIGAVLAGATLIARASVKPYQDGVFALLGGSQHIASHFWADHQQGLTATLKVRQFRHDGVTAILNYRSVMTKYMHMIVVRDDFAAFEHLHPDYNLQTGTFSAQFTKEAGHKYYLYADSTPTGEGGQQVFRFTIDSDGAQAPATPSLAASPTTVTAGPYSVILSETTIGANQPHTFFLTVDRDGKAAGDLVPYLGAAAHCVLIGTSTLQYVHVHPTLKGQAAPDMSNMDEYDNYDHAMSVEAGPHMQMVVPALPAGVYKMWVEFEGGPMLSKNTAAFTVVAQ